MTDVNRMRWTVAGWSVAVLVIFSAFSLLATPSEDRPKRVKTVALHLTSSKADRMPLPEVVQAPQPAPEQPQVQPEPPPAVVPTDTPVPPSEVEEEPEMEKPVSKPEKSKFKDICAKNGGRKQTYYKGKHEMWRCVYGVDK